MVWASAQDPGTASSNCGTEASLQRRTPGRGRRGGGREEEENWWRIRLKIGKRGGDKNKLRGESGVDLGADLPLSLSPSLVLHYSCVQTTAGCE